MELSSKQAAADLSSKVTTPFCGKAAVVQSLSCVPFVTPQTVACQAPLFMGLPRQEYWRGLPFPSQGNLPRPRDGNHHSHTDG